jgi:hypothetical protein
MSKKRQLAGDPRLRRLQLALPLQTIGTAIQMCKSFHIQLPVEGGAQLAIC